VGCGAFKSGIALDLGTLLRALLHGFYSQDYLQAQDIDTDEVKGVSAFSTAIYLQS
jgi:hypothetical protein